MYANTKQRWSHCGQRGGREAVRHPDSPTVYSCGVHHVQRDD
jgi:ligand-binding sensor protein